MPKVKIKIGDLVMVQFLDHALHEKGGDGPVNVTVYGRVNTISDEHIHVQTFHSTNDHSDNDFDGYSIVRSCITFIRRLKQIGK